MKKTILIASVNLFTVLRFRLALIQALALNGYDVHVVTLTDRMDTNEKRLVEELKKYSDLYLIKHDREDNKFFGLIKLYAHIRKKAFEVNPSLIISFSVLTIIAALFATIDKRKDLCVSVLTGLGGSFHSKKTPAILKRILAKNIYLYSKELWFASKSDMKMFSNFISTTVHVGEVFYGAGVEIPKIVQHGSYKANMSKKIFAYVGRIRGDKGIDDFLNLAWNFDDAMVSFRLIGEYDRANKEIKEKVHHAIEAKRIEKYSSSDLSPGAIYEGVFALVTPTEHEGMPTIVLEAFANSVIVIMSKIPVAYELINSGARIFLFDKNNFSSIIDAVQTVSGLSLYEAHQIKLQNYNFVRNNFSRELIANRQLALVNKLYRV